MHNISVVGWLVILGLLALLLGWLLNRKRAPGALSAPGVDSADSRRLKGACFGDQGKADRLIQYEKRYGGRMDHAEAVRRALERLETDRSR